MRKNNAECGVRNAAWVARSFALVVALVSWAASDCTLAQDDPRRDPAVGTIVDSNPTTPAELVEAVDLLTRIEHADIAKPYLDRLIGMNLPDAQLAKLVEDVGVETFNRLRQYTTLPPEAGEFAGKALAAAQRARVDPQRLAQLADQALTGDETRRIVAIRELRAAGPVSVEPLLKIVASSDDPQTVEKASAVLLLLGGNSVQPLIGAIEKADDKTKVQIYRIFGQLGSPKVVPYLLADAVAAANVQVRAAAQTALQRIGGEVPSVRDAQVILYKYSESLLDGSKLLTTDLDGNATLWKWNPKTEQLTSQLLPEQVALAALAARTAKEAYAIDPRDAPLRRQYILATLQAAQLRAGLDRPLADVERGVFEFAERAGFDVIESVLDLAMERNHVPAAIAAADVLTDLLKTNRAGDAPRVDVLTHCFGQPCPLAKAVVYPDRRVRFAALQAIMAADPQQPFPGSSRVTEALGYFASASGVPHVTVADAQFGRAQQIASLFLSNGYEATSERLPRDFLLAALPDPDLAFVLMEMNVTNQGADTLLAAFRRDYRTQNVPVGLMAAPDELGRARALAADDPLTMVFVQPRDIEAAALRAEQLTALAGWRYVPDDVRREQARKALVYIAAESQKTDRLFDMLQIEREIIRAFLTPDLSTETAAALAPLGTPTSQRVLVNVASESLRPEKVREAAAAAFDESIRRFGVLLATDEVLEQYDRYNASESLDAKTQQILGNLLDSLEAGKQFRRDQKRKTEPPAAEEK